MRSSNSFSLKNGFLALTIALGGGLLALPATAGSTAGSTAEGYGQESHKDYMSHMEERISRAHKDFNDQSESDVNDDLRSYWNEVEKEWQELSAATEENWEEAKAEMDEAWQEFEKAWDESFSNKDK